MTFTRLVIISVGLAVFMGPSIGYAFETDGESEGKSFFVLGLHVDFGPDHYGPENTEYQFVKLTHYQLLLLRDAVEAADDDIDSDSDVRKLRKEVESAIDKLLDGDYDKALDKVEKFLKRVEDTDFYGPEDAEDSAYNRHGDLLSRGRSVFDMLLTKIIIPFAS